MLEYAELDRLLSRYFDGSVAADELALLESRLAADEQFAEHVRPLVPGASPGVGIAHGK